jgi:peptide-methionine (R)-S-oxide reductase
VAHRGPDGPPPTHQRFCINSVSLYFVASSDEKLPDKLGRGEGSKALV